MSISIKPENIRIGRFIRRIIFCSVIMAFAQLSLLAATASVTLAWDASPNAEVVGYKIYYGTSSHDYTEVVTVGQVTSVTIAQLNPGTTYYFAATTFDAAGNESAFSGETFYTVPAAAFLAKPVRSAGRFSFTVSGTAGAKYVVQASTNLIDWELVQTNIAPFIFQDDQAANYSQRFYRTVPLE